MQPIALLSAIPEEPAHLYGELEDPEPIALANQWGARGKLEGHDVVIGHSGMGKVAAAMAATTLLERLQPRALIFSGVAGGLDPMLDIGDVVIADRVVQADAGTFNDGRLERYQPSHLPFINPTDEFGWPSDPALVELAVRAAESASLDPLPRESGGTGNPPHVRRGLVATSDMFINDAAFGRKLYHELRAHVAEMEGGAVAQVAHTVGVPFVIVRAVSDTVGADAHYDFTRFLKQATRNSARIVQAMLAAMPSDERDLAAATV